MNTRMRRAARVVAVVVAAVLLAGCTEDPDIRFPGKARIEVDTPELRAIKAEAGVDPCRPGPRTGVNELPAVTLPCLGGGPDVDLSSLEGPLVVNLWGSWCGPCRKEMPVLAEFYDRYGDQVPLLGISVRDPQTTAAMELVRDTGVTYPLLIDTQDELPAKAPYPARIPVPSLTFVHEDGSVEVLPGAVETVEDLVDLVEEKLGISL